MILSLLAAADVLYETNEQLAGPRADHYVLYYYLLFITPVTVPTCCCFFFNGTYVYNIFVLNS